MVDIGDLRLDFYLSIYLAYVICGGDRFWYALGGIALCEHCLSLEI